VFDAIRDAIFAGNLKPGEPLRELHLAKDLQVSQASVREGLVHLENSGLVVRIPNKETRVTKLSNREVRERLELRESLEAMAWFAASKKMETPDYQPLAEKMNAISLAVERNAYPALAAADLDFHRYIWEHSQNPTLARMLEQLTAPLFAFVSLVHSINRDNLRNVVISHERVISALREGGARLIRERLREHITGSYDRFLNSGAEDLHDWYHASEIAGKK
jgi:DNA-binding GntR family transcriptional regulator